MTKARRSRTVWFDYDTEQLHFGDTIRGSLDWGFGLDVSELASITATDTQFVLADDAIYAPRLIVSDAGVEWLHEDTLAPVGVDFVLSDAGKLVIEIQIGLDEWNDDEDELLAQVVAVIGDLVGRHGASAVSVQHNKSFGGPPPFITEVQITAQTRGRTLADLFTIGEQARALLEASSGHGLTRETTVDLLRAGHAAVLIGQPEGPWLDAKSQLYDLTSPEGKIKLAQAVARFANSTQGGIVVFGIGTKKVGASDVMSKVHPVPTDSHTVRGHRQALETTMYPLPQNLEVEVVAVASGAAVVVHLPPQPETLKPFLVQGAIVDGKIQGAFISIVQRSGEDSVPTTAAAIHSAMSMNRLIDRIQQAAAKPQ